MLMPPLSIPVAAFSSGATDERGRRRSPALADLQHPGVLPWHSKQLVRQREFIAVP